jgi:hypothetical protein
LTAGLILIVERLPIVGDYKKIAQGIGIMHFS